MPAECWSNGRLLMATSLRLQGTKYRQYGDSYKKERILSYLKISQKPTIKSKPYNKEKILSCLKISQNPTLSTQGWLESSPQRARTPEIELYLRSVHNRMISKVDEADLRCFHKDQIENRYHFVSLLTSAFNWLTDWLLFSLWIQTCMPQSSIDEPHFLLIHQTTLSNHTSCVNNAV